MGNKKRLQSVNWKTSKEEPVVTRVGGNMILKLILEEWEIRLWRQSDSADKK